MSSKYENSYIVTLGSKHGTFEIVHWRAYIWIRKNAFIGVYKQEFDLEFIFQSIVLCHKQSLLFEK